jgi:hypothetical protein
MRFTVTLSDKYASAEAYTVKKVCGSWNQKLYIGEYSGIYSLKWKNSGIYNLKGQSHEKVGEMSVWGISLGPN